MTGESRGGEWATADPLPQETSFRRRIDSVVIKSILTT